MSNKKKSSPKGSGIIKGERNTVALKKLSEKVNSNFNLSVLELTGEQPCIAYRLLGMHMLVQDAIILKTQISKDEMQKIIEGRSSRKDSTERKEEIADKIKKNHGKLVKYRELVTHEGNIIDVNIVHVASKEPTTLEQYLVMTALGGEDTLLDDIVVFTSEKIPYTQKTSLERDFEFSIEEIVLGGGKKAKAIFLPCLRDLEQEQKLESKNSFYKINTTGTLADCLVRYKNSKSDKSKQEDNLEKVVSKRLRQLNLSEYHDEIKEEIINILNVINSKKADFSPGKAKLIELIFAIQIKDIFEDMGHEPIYIVGSEGKSVAVIPGRYIICEQMLQNNNSEEAVCMKTDSDKKTSSADGGPSSLKKIKSSLANMGIKEDCYKFFKEIAIVKNKGDGTFDVVDTINGATVYIKCKFTRCSIDTDSKTISVQELKEIRPCKYSYEEFRALIRKIHEESKKAKSSDGVQASLVHARVFESFMMLAASLGVHVVAKQTGFGRYSLILGESHDIGTVKDHSINDQGLIKEYNIRATKADTQGYQHLITYDNGYPQYGLAYNGNVVAPPIYSKKLSVACYGLYRVKRGGKYGYVNHFGKEIVNPDEYEEVSFFSSGNISVKHESGVFEVLFIENGQVVERESLTHNLIGGFRNGYCVISKNGKEGIIDTTGNEIIEPIHDAVFQIGANGEYAYYAKDGGYVFVRLYDGKKYTITDGKTLLGVLDGKIDINKGDSIVEMDLGGLKYV